MVSAVTICRPSRRPFVFVREHTESHPSDEESSMRPWKFIMGGEKNVTARVQKHAFLGMEHQRTGKRKK